MISGLGQENHLDYQQLLNQKISLNIKLAKTIYLKLFYAFIFKSTNYIIIIP